MRWQVEALPCGRCFYDSQVSLYVSSNRLGHLGLIAAILRQNNFPIEGQPELLLHTPEQRSFAEQAGVSAGLCAGQRTCFCAVQQSVEP